MDVNLLRAVLTDRGRAPCCLSGRFSAQGFTQDQHGCPNGPASDTSSISSFALGSPVWPVSPVCRPLPSSDSTSSERCPMCHQAVFGDLLSHYQADGRMICRQQAAFCRAHRQDSARQAWTRRRYPDINWGELKNRFTRSHPVLKKVIKDGVSVQYRATLNPAEKSSRQHAMHQSQATVTGYYGERGLDMMWVFPFSIFSQLTMN